jgi:hypothetical protein
MYKYILVALILIPSIALADDTYNRNTQTVNMPVVNSGNLSYEVEMKHDDDMNFRITKANPITRSSSGATIQTTIRTNTSAKNTESKYNSEVISVRCNAGEVLTGGSCACWVPADVDADANVGAIKNCVLGNIGVLGGCATSFSDANSVVGKLYGSPITVYAVCAPGTYSPETRNRQTDELEEMKQKLIEEMNKRVEMYEQALNN